MTMPKRVLHFQGRMGKGGAETFMMNAYRSIDRLEYQFDFVIYEDFKDVTPYHEEIKKLGGNIYITANPNKNIIKYIKDVKKILSENDFDIVHNEIFFGGGINLWLANKAGIKKRIAHSHATSDGKGNKFPYGLVRTFLNKLLKKNATDFLACSHEAGVGLFGDNEDFIVIPNGIDLKKYNSVNKTKEELKERLVIPSNAFVIGHIGRFEDQKNHRFLLQIFEYILIKHPNTYLLSVGTGNLEEEIKMLSEQNGIDSHTLFLGERNDIDLLMNTMDVFLLPSLYEGLPIVAIEAQAAGVKLVLSDEVSRDTILSENVEFVGLQDPLESWERAVMEGDTRNEPLPKLFEFDMEKSTQLLTTVYKGK